jgi:SAM-dependent methyltransferase
VVPQPTRAVRSRSFGEVAEDYDRYRPAPPMAAVDWVLSALPAPPARAGDVAAGTGALTRLLGARVESPVLVIEPDDRMIGVLVSRIPNALAVRGRGEALPWLAGSLDALLMGSAWHWMDPIPTLSEISRVLRPGGVFGILGNGPDREVGWVARLFDRQSGRAERPRPPTVPELPAGMPFSDPEAMVIRYSLPMTRPELVGMAGTFSSVITLPPDERRERRSVTERLAADAVGGPDVAETSTVDLPMRCRCWRTIRTSSTSSTSSTTSTAST